MSNFPSSTPTTPPSRSARGGRGEGGGEGAGGPRAVPAQTDRCVDTNTNRPVRGHRTHPTGAWTHQRTHQHRPAQPRPHPSLCGSERGMSAPVLSVRRPLSPPSRRLRAVSASLACCAAWWASKSGMPKVAMRGPASARGRTADAATAPALARTRTPPTTLAVAPPLPPTDGARAALGALAPPAPSASAATPARSTPPCAGASEIAGHRWPPSPADAAPAWGATADAEAAGKASSAPLPVAASPAQSTPPCGAAGTRAGAPRPLPPADPTPDRAATVDGAAAAEASDRVPASSAAGADTARDALPAALRNSCNFASGIGPSTRPCHPGFPC